MVSLDHNFWTQNPSRSSKVSKDSDCSLVTNKNLSEILPSNGWCPGPRKVGQGALKVLHLWRHSQKTRTPNQKNFRVHSRRLAASFDTSTRSVICTGAEIFPCKATCVSVYFFQKSPFSAGCQSVKWIFNNFWIRNIRKLIKGSKDSDSSLVSNENFSEILLEPLARQHEPKWPKTYLVYDVTQKNLQLPTKKFFLLQTGRRLAKSFKGLNSSLAQLAEELWRW